MEHSLKIQSCLTSGGRLLYHISIKYVNWYLILSMGRQIRPTHKAFFFLLCEEDLKKIRTFFCIITLQNLKGLGRSSVSQTTTAFTWRNRDKPNYLIKTSWYFRQDSNWTLSQQISKQSLLASASSVWYFYMFTCNMNSLVISCSLQLNQLMKMCFLYPSHWTALHRNSYSIRTMPCVANLSCLIWRFKTQRLHKVAHM
jgi:hypothetical protein